MTIVKASKISVDKICPVYFRVKLKMPFACLHLNFSLSHQCHQHTFSSANIDSDMIIVQSIILVDINSKLSIQQTETHNEIRTISNQNDYFSFASHSKHSKLEFRTRANNNKKTRNVNNQKS